MISHQYRCIFIHQRKCAGTSIIRSFGIEPQMREWHLFNDGVLAPEWAEFLATGKPYFVFSVVRNPFDRVVSAWKYLESTKTRSLATALADPPRPEQGDGHDYRHFTRQQVEILRPAGSSELATDYLIRYEDLQQDYAEVCARIGKAAQVLPWLNPTPRERDYRGYFDASSRRLAEALFAEDLQVFGYSF
ncbi:MAG: sulfotransferase family 2 domain-containing protein [Candidatus Sericytochromatia bacterium]